MKQIHLSVCLLCAVSSAIPQNFSEVIYEASNENFANPERGFYHFVNNVNYDNLVSFREEEAITLIYKNYSLEDYTASEIPFWYLQNMEADFETMRKAGTKVVLRFSYTNKATPPYGDAPPEIVQLHIAQLKPYLQANSDVICVLQAGFIGAWGEWYYTDYFSTSPGQITEEQWELRRDVVYSLLDAMPVNRQVQIRTPKYKRKILDLEEYVPVSPELAFTDTALARIAHHNDCFVADNSDMGTYSDTAVEKPYLHEDSKYTMVGGETCQVCECASCENSLRELKRFHWTYINIDYHTAVLQGWMDEGCFPEVERKLGYRYRLLSATVQEQAKPGGAFAMTLKILNDGWANPMNPRNLELVIRNNATSEEYYLPLEEDPRFWPLEDTVTVTVDAGFPQNIPVNGYTVLLNLPDPEPRLYGNPLFSIRTANTDVWEQATGYNSLLAQVDIQDNPGLPGYSGGDIFIKKNAIAPENLSIVVDGNPQEWGLIPAVYASPFQPAKEIRYYNSPDSLYFLVTGDDLQPESQVFIDADLDQSTGFIDGPWSDNGADYMVDGDMLYTYTGTGQSWDWSLLGDASLATNDTVYEMGIPLALTSGVQLANAFAIGFVNDPAGSVQASYLPEEGESFKKINLVTIYGSPNAMDASVYGNNNVIFWAADNATSGVYNVLERSVDGSDFNPVYISQNRIVAYADKNLVENKTYSYRLKFQEGNTCSQYQGPLDVTAAEEGLFLALIDIDGDPSDWIMVPPVATAFSESIEAFRMTNRAGKLHFSLTGSPVLSYQVYFSPLENTDFEYKVSNDSLFQKDNSTWEFTGKITSASSVGFLEASIDFEDVTLIDKDIFYVQVHVNDMEIPANRPVCKYLKNPVIPLPLYFWAEPSINNYYTNSVVKWSNTPNVDGYILERSVGDSLNFEVHAIFPGTVTYFIDTELDSAYRYYYRMFTHWDIYGSEYTQVSSVKPGYGMGVEEKLGISNGRLTVSPNPFNESAVIELTVTVPEKLTVDLYDYQGQRLKTLFTGKVFEKKMIALQRGYLVDGIYFLMVSGPSTEISHKIILN